MPTVNVDAIGGDLFHYEVVGVNAAAAAAEFDKALRFYERNDHIPQSVLRQDIADIRQKIAKRFGVEIKSIV